MTIVAASVGATVALQRMDTAFPLVVVWALVAIAVRHSAIALISGMSGGLAIVLVVLVGFRRFRS